MQSFTIAQEMGATALESDVWITADGEAVLDHDGVVQTWRGTKKIRSLNREKLPAHIPTLAQLYDTCGTGFELSLDVKDPAAAARVVEVTRQTDPTMLERLWLCNPNWQTVASWRALSADLVLVDSTRVKRIGEGLASRLGTLVNADVNALNMHHTDWTAEMVALTQQHGLRAMAWDLQRPADLTTLLDMGVDAIFSDHVDRMLAAMTGQQETGRNLT